MTTLLRRRLSGHPQAVTLPAGGGSGGASGTIQSFTLTETTGATSVGMARQGMAFKQGHVPAGSRPIITRSDGAAVAHQWSGQTTYPDGSLKFAVFSLRDAAFAASQARTYNVTQATGSAPAGTGLALSSVLAAHDFKAVFNNVQQTDGTTPTARAPSLTASLATHAATSTRITKMADGPVAPCWKLWGMAGSDTHLKTNSYVIPWLNADGSVYAVELCIVAAQDWWSIANKYQLNYDAVLMDGATTVATYSGVQHPYGSQWAMVRTTQDNNFCRAPWIGGAMPTLTYGFDRTYWVKCAAVPPFDSTLAPAAWSSSLPTFIPCRGISSDVENVDGTGVAGGRGIVPGPDGAAFMRQGAFDYAYVRRTALDAVHAPFHARSNRIRTRPGDSAADTANSVIPLILLPKTASDYDFTADGLPVAVHAYSGYGSYADWQDGYVYPGAGLGPYWSHNYPNSSHLYAYAYMSYLFEGSPWLLESGVLDWCMFAVQQQVGHLYAQRPLMLDDYRANGTLSAMPNVTYTGITCWCDPSTGRAAAWALNLTGQAAGIVPDAHEAARCIRKLNSHNGDWIAQSLAYMPASQQAAGEWADISPTGNYVEGADVTLTVPFFSAAITMSSLFNYRLTGVAAFKQLGLMTANKSVRMVSQGCYYTSAYYFQATNRLVAPIDFTTNDWVDPAAGGFANTAGTTVSGSATITMGLQNNEGTPGACSLPIAPGDIVTFTKSLTPDGGYQAIPAEVTEGAPYYVVSVPRSYGGYGSGITDQIQVAAAPNGAPIIFASAYNVAFFIRPASANPAQASPAIYVPTGDNYQFMHSGALAMATIYGHSSAPRALAKMLAFHAPADRSTYMPSALAV